LWDPKGRGLRCYGTCGNILISLRKVLSDRCRMVRKERGRGRESCALR